MITSWFDLLKIAMQEDGEKFSDKKCTLSDRQLKKTFDAGYGTQEGKPFTAWGENWVYFPLEYDGSEGIGHAPRNPCKISMEHQ